MTGRVYRAYDAEGVLLYVGSSNHPPQRYEYHRQHSPWWLFKAEIREQEYPSLTDARTAELVAIETEHPRWNVVGRSVDHPDGWINQAFGIKSAPWLRDELEAWRAWNRTGRKVPA